MLLEVPTKQDVEKGINAAAGITETDGDTVAYIEGEGWLRNLKIHELDYMGWGSAYHKHAEHGKPHESLPGDIDGVTAKQKKIPSMESQGGKTIAWIECTNKWQLFETKFTCSASKGQLSATSSFCCLHIIISSA